MTSVDGWAYTAIASLVVLVILLLVYLMADRIAWRKIGFFGGFFFLLLFGLANMFAHQQREHLTNRTGAIITSVSASVKKTPAENANEEFILHEGTRVEIQDKSLKNWYLIQLADGREGWIETSKIEEI